MAADDQTPPAAASAPEPVSPPKRGRKKKLAIASAVIGTVLALACLWFVGAQLAKDWDRSKELLADARWGWLILAVPLALAGMSLLSFVWRNVLAALGAKVSLRQVFVWYQIGMLGKYIPGGVVQVVGRGEMATKAGVPRATAYNSVALSMGCTHMGGALVSAVLLPFVLLDSDAFGRLWWVLLVIPIGLVCLHPKVLSQLFRLAEKLFGGAESRQIPGWSTSVLLVFRHAPGWLVNGLACWVTALAFVPSAPIPTVVFAGIISWTAGFLVVFVPSGAGVREAMFVALTASALGGPAAAATAIVSRLVFVLGDVLGATLAVALRNRGNRVRS